MNKLSAWLNSPIRRYIVIGSSVYVFELLVIVAAQKLGAGSVEAVSISFWFGLLASFALQKLITFRDKRLQHRILLPQLVAFSLLVLFNFSFTVLLTDWLTPALPAVWCRTIAIAITTMWNFYLYKSHIFAWQKSAAKKRPTLTKLLQKRRRQIMKRYRKWRSKPRIKRLRKYAGKPKTGKAYLLFSLTVLFATTMLWSLLGAHLQQSNADQLVNAHLFNDTATFQAAIFPEQHSFLIKWPLFYLIKLLGYSSAAFVTVTALASLLTVAAFAFALSRIERRPLVLGTLCLLLASVLLLVPAQPYAGGLLPVNMAMLATRNLEYVLYVAGLVCLISAPRLRSRQFAGAIALLILLVSSDKLFLSVSTLGAFLATVSYILYKRRESAGLAARWLLLSVITGMGAALLIALVDHAHITHINGSQAGPYGLVHSVRSAALGMIYAVSGLLTNFGANPAYDATTLRQIPHSIWSHFFSPAAPAYLLNLSVFLFSLCVSIRFLWGTLHDKKQKAPEIPAVRQLTMVMLWSAIAVIVLFIAADHYHQVDARYLTLCLFAFFVALAGWFRPRRVEAELIAVCLPVLLFCIVCGIIGNIQIYTSQKQALDDVDYRNKVIAQTLASHHVKVLAGDYWRVVPVQSLTTDHRQEVMPLEGCSQPRGVLTSTKWQPDLRRTSFAYLLSLNKGLTDYPRCGLHEVVKAYGIPNSSALIDGSLAHPKELLLFYDNGLHVPRALSAATHAEDSILPVALDDLMHTGCDGPTIMNIVAHQDDDLLFMSPDLIHDITDGHCVRSVYLTAGDAGDASPYWLSREQGSEAAYSEMTGSKAAWMHRNVRLPGGQFVTVASQRGNDRISLVFMHLPDGNLDGRGFGSSHHESMAELESKHITRLQTVDGQSTYTSGQLADALAALMRTYRPTEIRTQSNYLGSGYKDHSDHRAAGRFTVAAYQRYESRDLNNEVIIPLLYYIGYPIRELEPDVSGTDLEAKEAAFAAYAAYDNSVCRFLTGCQQNPVYGIYLMRQYRNAY